MQTPQNAAVIVLVIDPESYKNDHENNQELTADELERQGRFVNEDAAGMYGYAGWYTLMPGESMNQCTYCDEVGPGMPGAGGAAHICNQCAAL